MNSELNNLNEYEALRKQYRLLPVKVSSFYKKKVAREVEALGHINGPLHRVVYPSLEKNSLKPEYEVADFIDDRSHMPEVANTSFMHKYANRVLFLPLSICLSNCMYCFRQDVLEEKKIKPNSEKASGLEENLQALIEYLNSHSEVNEVILSGGDPMMLPANKLRFIFENIVKKTKVQNLRIHTRSIIFDPKSMTEQHIQCLVDYKVRTVFHIVHPYEICSEVRIVIDQLRNKGLRLYNQFPILRKVNDHVAVLTKLLFLLDELNIKNLSIFFPEPVHYSASFRINFKRLFSLIDEFNQSTPSWINSTRFCQDTILGKVRLENLIEYNEEKGYAIFARKGKEIKVPDHPEKLDVPGELKTLLWED